MWVTGQHGCFLDGCILTRLSTLANNSVTISVYVHSPVARTLFFCAHPHFSCVSHTRMARTCQKGSWHMCRVSLSPFSCLTHLLLSPYDDLSLSRLSRPHVLAGLTCPQKRRACASPHEDEYSSCKEYISSYRKSLQKWLRELHLQYDEQ